MRCIIIEDEPMAMDLMKRYVSQTPMLKLINTFSNPLNALAYVAEHDIDLIFLDIQMPELTGIQFVQSLSNSPLIIFTTAYHDYGVESYEYNTVDYLLKPITYPRFLKAVNKAKNQFSTKITNPYSTNEQNQKTTLTLKSGSQTHLIHLENLKYVEGTGNYLTLHIDDGRKILILMTLKEVESILPDKQFIRIHKSYIISLSHLMSYERHQVKIGNTILPVGMTFREHFFSRIKK